MIMRYLRFLSLAGILFFTSLILPAQSGHKIKITIDNYPDSVLYLVNYYGQSNLVKDTAYLKKGRFVFAGRKALPGGIYLAVTKDRKYFEFLVDKDQDFELHTQYDGFTDHMKVKGSQDNTQFYEYLTYISKKDKERKNLEDKYKDRKEDPDAQKELKEKLKKITDDVIAYKENFIAQNPDAFLTVILKASKEPEIPTELPKKDDGTPDSSYIYKYYKAHYFDGFDFADGRLIRTPIYAQKLKTYFTKVLLQQPDTLIKEADAIIAKARPDSDTYKYCIWYFTYASETSQIMGLDAVFVHLVKKYYETGEAFWVNETVLKNITERAQTLDRLLIGKVAPNMIMWDTNKRLLPLYGVKADFTVVLFWDPDCGHCRHEIPIIKKWMDENAVKYGVKVFAVCSDTSLTKWMNSVHKFGITDWVNVNGTRSATENYHDLYDIISTPTIYLLDRNKKIIAKRIGHKELFEIIEREYKKEQAKAGDDKK